MTDVVDHLITTSQRHNLGYERIVLGSMLTAPAVVDDIAGKLEAADFYKPGHITLFNEIIQAQADGRPTEPVALGGYLLDQGRAEAVGGLPYLLELVEAVPVSASAMWYAQQLREMSDRRKVLASVAHLAQVAASGATADALHDMARRIVEESTPRGGSDMVSLGEFIGTGIADIEERRGRRGGLPTGFIDLDRLFAGGLRPGELVIIAARPGVGKSTLALDIARHVAIRHKRPVGFFSFEMFIQELFDRAISAEANIAYNHVRRGELDEIEWQKASHALGPMSEAPLFISDERGQTVNQIANRCRKVQARYGLDLVITDYLQLIKGSRRGDSREQEVSEVARGLKNLAGDLKCPLIAVAQLNRGPEQRSDKRPQLSDLRESGEIEQAADIVIMVHRDDRYDPESPRAGEADLVVVKNRAGAEDTITVAAQLHVARFVDMAIE